MSGDERSRELLLDEVRRLRQRLGEAEQREAALARREGLYRAAIEAAGAVPYARNYLTGDFDYVGPGIRALLGHAPEAFTVAVWNASVLEVFPFGQATDLSARDASNWLRAREGPGWWADLRVRNAAGEERWLTNAAVKVHDERGQLVGSLG